MRALRTVAFTFLAALVLLATGSEVAWPDQMYWTDSGTDTIRRANLDGTGLQVLLSTGMQPWGIALDVAQDSMYWAEYGTGRIRRANLDGTGAVNLLIDQPNVSGLVLDLAAGKMYWTVANLSVPFLRRANLDGTNVQDIATSPSARDLALDIAGGKVYWTYCLLGTIQRANLDGTSPETIVTGLDKPYGIELDTVHGLLYWADSGTDRIRRANLDGTGVTDVLTGLSDPVALALDVAGGKLYWSFHLPPTGMRSANVDGTNTEDLFVGGNPAYDIALQIGPLAPVPEPSTFVLGSTCLALLGIVMWRRLRQKVVARGAGPGFPTPNWNEVDWRTDFAWCGVASNGKPFAPVTLSQLVTNRSVSDSLVAGSGLCNAGNTRGHPLQAPIQTLRRPT